MTWRSVSALAALIVVVISVRIVLDPASVPSAEAQDAAEFKGAKKCKTCHKEQHTTWTEMKHSKSMEVLTAEQVAGAKDDKGHVCVQCHTTGYGQPTGFTSMEKTPQLAGVGCEACHGPGSIHIKLMTRFMLEETTPEDKRISKSVGCAGCHNPHISHKKIYGGK